MGKEESITSKKIYFACLGIYQSAFSYDFDQNIANSVTSELAIKVGTIFLLKYEIVQVLREDSFGFTYLIKEISNKQKYIVKEFFPKEFVTRNDANKMIMKVSSDIDKLTTFNYMQNFFTREAHTLEKLSTLNHPNIIRVDKVMKNINNTTYIFYPYQKGTTLKAYLEWKENSSGKLNNKEINKILQPLLSAVEHLHSLNIYHLNISFENIFIRDDGVFSLLGFEASALFYDQYSNMYCNGYTAYTTAPEQIKTELFSQIGQVSDIYAIGVLLYRMITGVFPPEAKNRISDNDNKTDNHAYISLENQKDLLSKYDPFLLYSVDKALEFSGKQRFGDIDDFNNALEEGPSRLIQGFKNNKKNVMITLFIAGVLLFIILLFNIIGDKSEIKVDNPPNPVLKIDSVEKVSELNTSKENNIQGLETEHTHKNEIKVDNPPSPTLKIDIVEEISELNNGKEHFNSFEVEENNTQGSETEYTYKNEIKVDDLLDSALKIDTVEEVSEENNTERYLEILNVAVKEKVESSTESESMVTEEKKIKSQNEFISNTLDTAVEKVTDKELSEEINVEYVSIDENTTESVDEVSRVNVPIISEDAKEEIKDLNVKKPSVEDSNTDIDETILINTFQKTEPVNIKYKTTVKKKAKKKTKNNLKKRKKRVIKKKRIKKQTSIQRKKIIKNSTGLIWYCKATAGNIRTSAKSPNKIRSKNIALSKCRKKSANSRNCRILHCIPIR